MAELKPESSAAPTWGEPAKPAEHPAGGGWGSSANESAAAAGSGGGGGWGADSENLGKRTWTGSGANL